MTDDAPCPEPVRRSCHHLGRAGHHGVPQRPPGRDRRAQGTARSWSASRIWTRPWRPAREPSPAGMPIWSCRRPGCAAWVSTGTLPRAWPSRRWTGRGSRIWPSRSRARIDAPVRAVGPLDEEALELARLSLVLPAVVVVPLAAGHRDRSVPDPRVRRRHPGLPPRQGAGPEDRQPRARAARGRAGERVRGFPRRRGPARSGRGHRRAIPICPSP